MRDIIGHGGGKGGGSSHTHYEAPDSLHSTSYARVLDLVSEGEILGLAEGLQSVYLNDTPVQNEDGSSNFQGITVDFRTGTQAQDYIPGFPDVESETTVGVELKYGTPWVRAISNTSLSAVRITLGVDQLYKADTNNGDVGGSIVRYAVELSTDGGAYQTVLSNSFNGKTMSAYQRSARIDLPRATTGWQIRVTRLTPNSTVVSVVDKTTIISFTEVIDAKLRYPMSAIVGVQVDAKQFQSVPTRAYDLFGRIIQVPSNYDAKTRTYSGTWDGTFKPSWSDNPAWVFRDLALNDRYGLGNRITAAQLDKWALYKIARYCDEMVPNGKGGTEPRFSCNLYLQTRKQAYAVLQDIASIFRGISYWGAGTIMASADMPSDPVYVYTAANVIGGKFTRTGTKKATRYTVALVTWNDPADGYKPKVEYVEDRDGIARYGIQQTELTAFGCTSQGQAHRAGRWALATSRLETEGITFDVGMDGAIALPGQIVRIADPSRMGRRVGGRVRAVAGRTVTLDKAPTVNVGDRLTVMMPAGASETRAVAAVSGDAVTVDSDWTTAPRTQAVWSVDSNELSAPLFRVLSVTEKDSITFTITAVQHEPGKYDFVEKGTAITPRTQTALDVTRQAPPSSVTLAGYTVSLADVQKLALQVSCAPVAGAVAYEGAYRRGNDNWIAIPRQPSPTMDVLDILPGTYMARMSAVNSIGVTSLETQSVAVEIARDGVSKNATIILQSDAQQFHTDQNGQTDPLTITFSAILIALEGPVDWSCLGGTLTNATATTAQLTFANTSGAAAVVTAKVTAFGRTYTQSLTIRKVQDGAAGSDGLQTDVARLYQWAPTTPSKPAGTSTFSWAGLTNSGYTGNDGWANPAPNNPGTPGWRLYVASVGVSAPIAATSSPVGYSNATIEAWSQNGAKGDPGASGVQSRPATVYRWDVSIPAGPAGSATFKWSDGSYGAAPTNWTLTPGTAPSLGMTLFAATVQVTDSAASATTAFNWQSAAVMAIGYVGTNGQPGQPGGPGQQGASYVTAYIASSAIGANGAPAQTTGRASLPAANSSGLAGAWSAAVPALTDGQRMYQSDGIYDPTTDKVTWSIPYWSSLKVGTLSAITANLGAINGGSINLGNGTFTVDNDGNLVCRSIKIVDPVTGETVLQAGGQLNPKYAAPGTLNSELGPTIDSKADAARVAAINAAAADAQAKADAAANAATSAATTYAKAQADLAKTTAQAYADGKVTAEEQRAISDAAAKAEAARVAAVSAAAADATAKAAVAATMADYDKVKGRPENVSNIVKKFSFEDGQIQGWKYAQGIEAIGGGNASAVPYTKQLVCRGRDTLETDNYFSVTPGETLYFESWLNTEASTLTCCFGVLFLDKNGQFAGTAGVPYVPPNIGWLLHKGSGTVPPNAASAVPWLWENGSGSDFDNGNWLRAAGMWIGRHARGATVGAPSGTMVGGTEAGLVASRAAYGQQAYDALPGVNNTLAAKLDAAGNQNLSGPVYLTSAGAIVVGTVNDGVRINTGGIIGRKGGYTTFSIASDGTALFGGVLAAATGTLGSLTIDGGNIRSSTSQGFGYWAPAGGPNVMYLGPEGLQLGNYNNGRFIHAYANGNLYMPGFSMVDGQLTLTNPVIITPKVQTTFSVSMPEKRVRNVTGNSITFGVSCVISNGTGPFRYSWTFSADPGPSPMALVSNPSSETAAIKASGSGWLYGYISVTVYDSNGAVDSASARVSVQFGNSIEP